MVIRRCALTALRNNFFLHFVRSLAALLHASVRRRVDHRSKRDIRVGEAQRATERDASDVSFAVQCSACSTGSTCLVRFLTEHRLSCCAAAPRCVMAECGNACLHKRLKVANLGQDLKAFSFTSPSALHQSPSSNGSLHPEIYRLCSSSQHLSTSPSPLLPHGLKEKKTHSRGWTDLTPILKYSTAQNTNGST